MSEDEVGTEVHAGKRKMNAVLKEGRERSDSSGGGKVWERKEGGVE